MALGVLRNEGILGFWRGNGLNILRTAPYKVGATSCCIFCTKHRMIAARMGGTDPQNKICLCLLLQAVNFSSYDAYRKLMQRHSGGASLGRMGSFGAGALAGDSPEYALLSSLPPSAC